MAEFEEQEPVSGSTSQSSSQPEATAPPQVELLWRHYLYEFFIVALGISVPFLLDRWNQQVSDRRAERQIYQNLQRELAEDLSNLTSIRQQNHVALEQYQFGRDLIRRNDRDRIDTLMAIAMNMSDVSDFHRSSAIYQTLVNSGDVQLIRNRQVLKRIQDLEEWYIYMNRLEDNHLSVFIDQILPELLQNLQLEPLYPLHPEWFYSPPLSNLLQLSVFVCEEKEGIYQQAEEVIADLQQLLLSTP